MGVLKVWDPIAGQFVPVVAQGPTEMKGIYFGAIAGGVYANGGYTDIAFGAAVPTVNTLGGYAASAFTAPRTGWYLASMQGNFGTAAGTVRALAVEVGGSIVYRTAEYIGGNNQPHYRSVEAMVYLTAGQVLNFSLYQDSGGNLAFNVDRCSLVEMAGSVGPPGSASATSGLAFPATQVPSADPNTLDDYEENSWTPTADFGGVACTITGPGGWYTKVGRLVTVIVQFTITVKGAGTGQLYLRGLPYAVHPTIQGGGHVSYGEYLTVPSVSALMPPSGTYMSFWGHQASGGMVPFIAAHVNANATIHAFGQYFVA